ncbi:zinc ribbon domain-containing protein [Bacillus andreraoultii]|uniref:zinc ribbon domain-containing protein n=1 Tax=Bacillus andreraoultii TaxID=1499685 RepID=UPI00053ABD39|nr:zinc ribbon domain-containing protein [Bacillus andreraoultii]
MSRFFCENCGSKLNENSNFCPSCGHKLQNASNKRNESEEILSLSSSSKRNIINTILFILIAMFSVSFYIVVFMLAFKWEGVINAIYEDYDGSSFVLFILLPLGYLLGIIIISKLFNSLKISKLFVKITFLTSLFMIITFTLHIIFTTFLYFNSEKAIEAVISDFPSDVGLHQGSIVEESQGVLKSKINILLINIVAAVGYITIVLSRYFRKQSLAFIPGLKSIFHQPNITKFKDVFKQLD